MAVAMIYLQDGSVVFAERPHGDFRSGLSNPFLVNVSLRAASSAYAVCCPCFCKQLTPHIGCAEHSRLGEATVTEEAWRLRRMLRVWAP